MRQALGILSIAVFLLSPLQEWNHHHEPLAADSGCVACQFHHASLEPPPLVKAPEAPLLTVAEIPPAPERPGAPTDPLRVAPKTSPPEPR